MPASALTFSIAGETESVLTGGAVEPFCPSPPPPPPPPQPTSDKPIHALKMSATGIFMFLSSPGPYLAHPRARLYVSREYRQKRFSKIRRIEHNARRALAETCGL